MVLTRSYLVILVITIVSSVHLSSAFNFRHDDDELRLRGPTAERSYGPLYRNDVEMEAEPDLGDLDEIDSENDDQDHKFEIKLKLGNGVTVGCEVEKRSNYEDVTDMYLEDEFGRRSPEMGLEPPQAMFRAAPSLFTRHPEATADLLEMEVPYGWWPAECIQRIMGLSFENTLCNCPAGPPGLAGRPGPEGPSGPPGPPGLDGTNSTDGLPGPIGDAGPTGPPGLRGNPGAPGTTGAPGEAGPVGPPGNPGRDGRPGPPGASGSPGQDGKPGKNGRNGRNGRDGLQGPPGAAGIPGEQGLQGIAGQQGENGIPAPSGVNGINGANGEAGLPGRPGDNGPCGAASSSSGWSSTTPAEEGNGWTNDEITIEYTPEDNVESPPEEETQEEVSPPDQGGWSAEHEEELGATAWGGEIIAEPEPPVNPQPNPAITPAKPAQPAQSSLPMKPYQGKPVMGVGNNPFIPQPGFIPPRPQQGPAQAVGPSSSLGHHDKRPEYPVSQSFQGPNQLWSSPQFQSSIPMMQSYGQMGGIGNSQWKNSGIRASGPKKPCQKKGRGKGKRKPAKPQNDNSAKAETIRNVAQEVFSKPEANKAAVAPPRARVDLDLLQDTEDRSLH